MLLRFSGPLFLSLTLLCPWSLTWAQQVIVAVSEGSKDYEEVAEIVRTQLQRNESGAAHEVIVRPWQEVAGSLTPNVKVVVALGSGAFAGMADLSAGGRLGRVPVVTALLPRGAYESLRRRASAGTQTTAVLLDQPFVRQMALMRYAFPNQKRVGVLLGPDSVQHQPALEKAAAEHGLQLGIYRVDGEAGLYPALQRLLEENDLLLAVPDAAVFNGGSIQNVLLAAYRQKVPLMGFSPAYIRAGAVVALYSTPTQVGMQTARLARAVLSGSAVPSPQVPADFTVGVNASVARSLGFRLSDDALRIQLLGREGS